MKHVVILKKFLPVIIFAMLSLRVSGAYATSLTPITTIDAFLPGILTTGLNTTSTAPRFISPSSAAIGPSRLLWSVYPASVRGRVFGGSTGGDPFSGGGW
jgi:hypothetical protein